MKKSISAFKEQLSQIAYSDHTSKANRKLAKYIMVNYNYIVFLKASELAEEAGVSQSSVTRFVTNVLNFKGYASFIKFIQAILRSELTSSERYVMSSKQHESNMAKVIYREISNLEKIVEEIPEENLQHLAKKINKHPVIYIIGFRTGSALAKYFQFFLSKIHPDVRVCTNASSELNENLYHTNRKDTLVIVFAFPRYPQQLIEVIQFLKRENIPFITITDSDNLERWHICKCDLIVPLTMSTFFDSFVSVFCMINLLIDEVGKIDYQRTKHVLDQLETMYQTERIFYRNLDKS